METCGGRAPRRNSVVVYSSKPALEALHATHSDGGMGSRAKRVGARRIMRYGRNMPHLAEERSPVLAHTEEGRALVRSRILRSTLLLGRLCMAVAEHTPG